MRTKLATLASLLVVSAASFAEQPALTPEQQQLIDQTYQSVQADPLLQIQNAPGLTQEQKNELMAVYQKQNSDGNKACATLLCMKGTMDGGSGGAECDSAIDDYFEIRRYRKEKFDPARTQQARGEYLESCPSSENKQNGRIINSIYGTVYSRPF